MTFEEAKEVFINRGFVNGLYDGDKWRESVVVISKWLEQEPTTKNDLTVREFEGIEVDYPPKELCTYPEYRGKPYFGIKYKENGEKRVGYGTYKPEVLSQYLKDYFISTSNQDIKSRVSLEEIEKAYESIMDVAEGGYVDIEEIKVHFCKWLGREDK